MILNAHRKCLWIFFIEFRDSIMIHLQISKTLFMFFRIKIIYILYISKVYNAYDSIIYKFLIVSRCGFKDYIIFFTFFVRISLIFENCLFNNYILFEPLELWRVLELKINKNIIVVIRPQHNFVTIIIIRVGQTILIINYYFLLVSHVH